jgi:hypothetical protein
MRSAPDPLSPAQRALFWFLTIAVALSRLLARSASLWDWDEALFTTSMRDYDVVLHHPHPPGFPLYIVAARMVRFLAASDFRALQLVTLLGAMALFPLVVAYARELRISFPTALFAALLFSFFPNLWFYGGTAFSDIPATAVTMAACLFLLRGSRSRRDYYLGALLLGVATGFRSQSLLIGCAPALAATVARLTDPSAGIRRRWSDVAVACAIGATVIAISYGGAAWASSDPPYGYLRTCAAVQEWVKKVDSYLNPHRPALHALLGEFFVRPMRAGRIDIVVSVLASIGVLVAVVRRKIGVLLAILTFAPFMLLAWLLLDYNSIARYSVAYVAVHALLAAEGAAALGRPFSRLRRGLPLVVEGMILIVVTADYAAWTLPALREARRLAPTEAAMRWIGSHTRRDSPVVVAADVAPFAVCDLPSRRLDIVDLDRVPVIPDAGSVWYVTEGAGFSPRSRLFARPHGRIWELARRRYFEVAVGPATDLMVFASGWYGREGDGRNGWQWMGRRGVILLQPVAGRGRLALDVSAPSQLVGQATMTIRFNGAVADRVLIAGDPVERTLDLIPRQGVLNEVEISTDRVINPMREHISSDARDLGLQLHSVSWSAATP